MMRNYNNQDLIPALETEKKMKQIKDGNHPSKFGHEVVMVDHEARERRWKPNAAILPCCVLERV